MVDNQPHGDLKDKKLIKIELKESSNGENAD